jgi:Ice-binding-like
MVVTALSLVLVACGSQLVEFPYDTQGDAQADAGPNMDVEVPDVDVSDVSDGSNVSDALDATDALDEADVADANDASDSQNDVGQINTCAHPTIGAVGLGTADTFAILAKAGISTVPPSAITGDIGISPIARVGFTGFSEIMDPSGVFATSTQVTGKLYASDYTSPTPSNITTVISDMETAFNDAAGRAPSSGANIELGSGNIGGLTLPPGVYKWSTGLLIPSNVTLSGNCEDVWIFEIAKDFTVSNGVQVILAPGVVAKNVFWQVSGKVDVGTTAHVEGTILTKTQIAMGTQSSINGRLLAQTAVTLEQTTVVKP